MEIRVDQEQEGCVREKSPEPYDVSPRKRLYV